MKSVAGGAFVAMAIAFPIYLLWKGRMGIYLSLATSGLATSAATGTATIGTGATTTTYGPMGTPMGAASASGLSNIPIPGL